jgi:hypothetical protein
MKITILYYNLQLNLNWAFLFFDCHVKPCLCCYCPCFFFFIFSPQALMNTGQKGMRLSMRDSLFMMRASPGDNENYCHREHVITRSQSTPHSHLTLLTLLASLTYPLVRKGK